MPGNQSTQVSDLSVVEMGYSGPSSSSPEATTSVSKENPLLNGKELAPIAS